MENPDWKYRCGCGETIEVDQVEAHVAFHKGAGIVTLTRVDNPEPPEKIATTREHTAVDCERSLKSMPNFDQYNGVPAVFVCVCQRRWEFMHDEAEGDGWVLVA